MRKTKIICTIGPASENEEVLTQMCLAGMNVARLNFSHGSHPEHKEKIDLIKKVREKLNMPIPIMLDTKGPEIRLKQFVNGKEILETGQTFTLTTRDVEGTNEICGISYRNLPQDVKAGTTIMLDDGLIRMTALEVTDTDPGFAGNTATNALKPATVETGAEVKVPLFINEGDKIQIDTRTGEYLGRSKA